MGLGSPLGVDHSHWPLMQGSKTQMEGIYHYNALCRNPIDTLYLGFCWTRNTMAQSLQQELKRISFYMFYLLRVQLTMSRTLRAREELFWFHVRRASARWSFQKKLFLEWSWIRRVITGLLGLLGGPCKGNPNRPAWAPMAPQ